MTDQGQTEPGDETPAMESPKVGLESSTGGEENRRGAVEWQGEDGGGRNPRGDGETPSKSRRRNEQLRECWKAIPADQTILILLLREMGTLRATPQPEGRGDERFSPELR